MSAIKQRLSAIKILWVVVEEQQSLRTALPHYLKAHNDDSEHPLIRQLSYGSLRFFHTLDALVDQLISKDFKKSDRILRYVLILGLYQLIYTRTAEHAAVKVTVDTLKPLQKIWAKGVINACLRTFLRERTKFLDNLTVDPVTHYAHPSWFIHTLKKAWPEHWQLILEANNQQPPLFLRVNQQKISRDELILKLTAASISAHPWPHNASAIYIPTAGQVTEFPGFKTGEFSVQDPAAQFAIELLALEPNMHVLDACAAPGGKTCHMLEEMQPLFVIALDQDAQRLEKVQENLKRLALKAELCCESVENFSQNYKGPLFDRILLDAPCSATGVIRRHPDIKVLRQGTDIRHLANTQLKLLQAVWPLLKADGRLVYATCSVLPMENTKVLETFLAEQSDAQALAFNLTVGITTAVGQQIFPTIDNQDGFYYAVLKKVG